MSWRKISFVAAILIGVWFLFGNTTPVLATTETCTWTATTTQVMSLETNWDNGSGVQCDEIDATDSLVFDGTTTTDATWDATLTEVAAVTISSNYTGIITFGAGSATTTGNFLQNDGTVSTTGSGILRVGGDFTVNTGTWSGTSGGTMTLYGTDKTLTIGDGAPTMAFYNLNIEGSITLGSNVTTTNILTINSGATLNAAIYNLVLSYTGGIPLVNNGTFTASTSLVIYTGASADIASTTYYNLTIDDLVAGNLTGNTIVTNNLTVNSGRAFYLSTYDLALGGNLANSGTVLQSAGTTTMSGDAATLGASGGNTTLYNLTITGNTTTMFSNVTSTNVLTISENKELVGGTYTLCLTGSGTPLVKTGYFTASTSLVKYTNTGTVTSTVATYYNLELGTGTYMLGGSTTSTNSFVNAGTTTIWSAYYLYAPGTFDNNGTITESGAIKHPITSGSVKLTNSARTEVTSYGGSDSVYVTVQDDDGNLNVSVADTITGATVVASPYGDTESTTITLTETGVNTGIFRSAAIPFVVAAAASNNNSQLEVSGNNDLSLTFIDDKETADTGSDTALYTGDSYNSGGGGSGGGSPPPADTTPPTNTSIVIANGAGSTDTAATTLTIGATGADSMMISNTSAFTGATWETYATSKTWVLTSGAGIKTVYAKFKDAAGNVSIAVSDNIDSTDATVTTPVTETETVTVEPTAETPAVAATPAAETVTVSHNFTKYLYIGHTGDEVRQLQQLLKDLGYFTYPTITGYFGSVTKAAVVEFQKAKGLSSAPGWIGPQTRSALNELTAGAEAADETAVVEETPAALVTPTGYQFKNYLYIGSQGEAVKQLQQILKDLGYFTHPSITGYFGSVTKAAVVEFQKAKDLSPFPGYVGPGTRAALNKLTQ